MHLLKFMKKISRFYLEVSFNRTLSIELACRLNDEFCVHGDPFNTIKCLLPASDDSSYAIPGL